MSGVSTLTSSQITSGCSKDMVSSNVYILISSYVANVIKTGKARNIFLGLFSHHCSLNISAKCW